MVNVGLTISRGRMSPCFPGTDLLVVSADGGAAKGKTVATMGWHPLAWGQELMRRNVGTLLCAGMDQFLWGALRGHGIQVVPEVVGDPSRALERWRSGELKAPEQWPPCPARGRRQCRGRVRARRGKGHR